MSIIYELNEWIEESNRNKYLMLIPTDESKDKLRKYEKLCNKIRDLVRSITSNSENYDEKYMEIKFNWDNDLSLKKILELHNLVIVVKSVFHENNKYYLKVFLDECCYKL